MIWYTFTKKKKDHSFKKYWYKQDIIDPTQAKDWKNVEWENFFFNFVVK